jgi:hypothetical protein
MWFVRCLCSLAILGCGGRSAARGSGGEGEAEGESEAEGEAESEAESEGEPGCPAPRVFCDEPAPACAAGTYPAVDLDCLGGHCAGRCYTGACLPCAGDCESALDCVLVGRHGCDACANIGGCADAVPLGAASEDECYFTYIEPPPPPPAGCPTTCIDDPLCPRCWHCGPDSVRCEGGRCVPTWSSCEPACVCD